MGSPAGFERESSRDGTNTDARWKYAAWCNVFVVWVGLGGGFGVVKAEEGTWMVSEIPPHAEVCFDRMNE